MSLRPSMLPKLAVCACYEPNLDAGPQAGPKIAAILSVLETCKRLGVHGREYLLAVLPQLSYRATRPGLRDLTPIEELTPSGWQRACEGTGATLG